MRLRTDAMRSRRKLFKAIGTNCKKRAKKVNTLQEEYKAAKKMLKTAICRTKEAA